MVSTSDLKKGTRFEYSQSPFVVTEVAFQTPSARGANTLVKVKARDLITGQLRSFTFRAGENLPDPDIEFRKAQFLYSHAGIHYFMDVQNYDQYEVSEQALGRCALYLVEQTQVRVMFYKGRAVSIELPKTVDLRIVQCEPGIKGDTVSNVTKTAKLETGLELQVPLFVEQGEIIRVDTREGRYLERVRK